MRPLIHRIHTLITNGQFWFFRLFAALATHAFGLVCLLQPDLFTQGRSFSGMAWLPQPAWGAFAVGVGLALFLTPRGRWRQFTYLLAFFFHISITISFLVGAGTILTGSTTYGLLALFIAYAGITETPRHRGP